MSLDPNWHTVRIYSPHESSGGLLLPGALRTAPDLAKGQGLIFETVKLLTQPNEPPHSCHLQLLDGPITVVPCRAKTRSLHPRRSYFAPIRCRFENRPESERHMVEAPGTAPGSEWFITTAIYRHSRSKPAGSIYAYKRAKKRLRCRQIMTWRQSGGGLGRFFVFAAVLPGRHANEHRRGIQQEREA